MRDFGWVAGEPDREQQVRDPAQQAIAAYAVSKEKSTIPAAAATS
jgi:hypothetical protein